MEIPSLLRLCVNHSLSFLKITIRQHICFFLPNKYKTAKSSIVRPFLSDKFDITKHKRYKELSDFDKKNAFDVERYLKHELRLRMDEEFDCYEVDLTPATEEATA